MEESEPTFVEATGNESRSRSTPWTDQEDRTITVAVEKMGSRWGEVAKLVAGRSANGVRNRWHRLKQLEVKKELKLKGIRPEDFGGYNCRVCGMRKRGHVCGGVPVVKDAPVVSGSTNDAVPTSVATLVNAPEMEQAVETKMGLESVVELEQLMEAMDDVFGDDPQIEEASAPPTGLAAVSQATPQDTPQEAQPPMQEQWQEGSIADECDWLTDVDGTISALLNVLASPATTQGSLQCLSLEERIQAPKWDVCC
jgi:hypothetical protein